MTTKAEDFPVSSRQERLPHFVTCPSAGDLPKVSNGSDTGHSSSSYADITLDSQSGRNPRCRLQSRHAVGFTHATMPTNLQKNRGYASKSCRCRNHLKGFQIYTAGYKSARNMPGAAALWQMKPMNS